MGENEPSQLEGSAANLDVAVAALRKDYKKLGARIHALTHSVTCSCSGVTLRLHFPAFRQSQPTISELIDVIVLYLAQFALPRSECQAVDELYGKIDVEEFKLRHSQLVERAKALFILANKTTDRNGEAGELLLYLLTEWIIGAPQLIAKMSLKTNPNMPVHGADGVHIKYSKQDKRLMLYWGEAKIHAKVTDAVSAAVKSIIEGLQPKKLKHEIELVQRNIDFAGLDINEKEALLKYLDPFEDIYNERHDVITALVGFDFSGYATVSSLDASEAEAEFIKLAQTRLAELAPLLANALQNAKLDTRPIELFFFPVPSVTTLRDTFQEKIGWTK